jgi:cytochrome c556
MTMIVGCFMGGIAQKAKQHNTVITDAGKIADEIGRSRKGLAPFDNAFKKGYADRKEFVDALDKIKFDPPDPKVVYESALYGQKSDLVGQVMQFVAVANKLGTDIRAHIDQTRKDFDLLKRGDDSLKAAQPKPTENNERYSQYRFAMMLTIPTEEEANAGTKKFGATFVEIDMPLCGETKQPSPTYECPEPQPVGFRYRADPTQAWKDGLLAGQTGPVAGDKLVLFLPSSIIDVLAKSGQPTLAELRYNQRVFDLTQEIDALVHLGAAVEGQLRAQSQESKSFTFFM